MTPDDFTIARRMADRLMATCQPNEFWEELECLSVVQCSALDTIAFECQTCNHWFPVSFRHEGRGAQWFCVECI